MTEHTKERAYKHEKSRHEKPRGNSLSVSIDPKTQARLKELLELSGETVDAMFTRVVTEELNRKRNKRLKKAPSPTMPDEESPSSPKD